MALASKISATELTAQVTNRFQDKYIAGILINAPGFTYSPGTSDDAAFLALEPTLTNGVGAAGYKRQIISFSSGDIAAYSDGGVGLAQKATVFAHDGGATALEFTHAALIWSSGNITAASSTATVPSAGVNGTYLNLPIDATSGSGVNATFDLTITNGGAAQGDWTVTINKAGYDYAALDTIDISEATLVSAGAVSASAGLLRIQADTVNTDANAGNLITSAKTTNPASLIAGYEAAFYWNLKQYGFYESLLAI